MKCAAAVIALLLAGCGLSAAVAQTAPETGEPPAVAAPTEETPAEDPAAAAAAAAAWFPLRGDGPPPIQAERTLTRIAIGSCSEETLPIPIFAAVAAAQPDLFLYIGDNVYGDAASGDLLLPELRQAYWDLSMNAFFAAFSTGFPILATWDDHDYGLDDAGGAFPAKAVSEKLFETFWRDAALGAGHPGVYGAKIYGPSGRRVQVILLDTRFFRSPLKRSETPNTEGYRPYLPDADPAKTMLGDAQWAWLAAELKRPAEIRLVVSSVQVLADGHLFEGWRTLPAERARLYRTLRGVPGVVLLSGDRHVGGLYRERGIAPYSLHELTASSLNLPRRQPTHERDSFGGVVTAENFGLVEIDWDRRVLTLSVRGMDGAARKRLDVRFRDLGLR